MRHRTSDLQIPHSFLIKVTYMTLSKSHTVAAQKTCLPQSFCGSVIKHQSAESDEDSEFFLCLTLKTCEKHPFLVISKTVTKSPSFGPSQLENVFSFPVKTSVTRTRTANVYCSIHLTFLYI